MATEQEDYISALVVSLRLGPAQCELLGRLQRRRRATAPPRPGDVLEHLTLSYDLLPEELRDVVDNWGRVAVLDELPQCNLCDKTARYDGRLLVGSIRIPGYACASCWTRVGTDRLGWGLGTYLLTYDEIDAGVRELCDRVTDELDRESIWG